MTRFLDGPAAGQTLMIKRSPIFLRVTRRKAPLRGDGFSIVFDALDAPDDTPAPDEELLCYRATSDKPSGNVHLRLSGKAKQASGFYPIGEYALYPEQPADEVMRDNARWREWCKQQALAHNIKHA